jgi:hypothetical protein
LKASVTMGLTEKKALPIGDRLDDDRWHSVEYERRGMNIRMTVDNDKPIIGESFSSGKHLRLKGIN